jgi:hypothetical protein
MTEEHEIAYSALPHGTRVMSSDGDVIGTVERVLDIPDLDLFDGIVIQTSDGDRFVDRDQIARITTRAVHLDVTTSEAANLPVPDSAPTFRADSGAGDGRSLMGRVRQFIKGPKWVRERDEE